MSLLLFHIITGLILLIIAGARLVAMLGWDKNIVGLWAGLVIAAVLQLATGAGLLMQGASVLHVCGASILSIVVVLAAEYARRRVASSRIVRSR